MAQVCVALADDTVLVDTNMTLNLNYDAGDIEGIDETSLRLYRWDTNGANWVETPSMIALDCDTVSAPLRGSGVFALFGDATADGIAPAGISDLVAGSSDQPWSVRLTWTAPGDDGMAGRASVYILKYGTGPVTNWDAATTYPLRLTPGPSGQPESVTIKMPDPNTLYYFSLAAQDEAGNLAPPSNESVGRSQYADDNQNGIPDQLEASLGGSSGAPLDPGADPDNDGLTTGEEYAYGTDPLAWDSDGDGMSDKWEIDHHLNPLSSDDANLDPDGDGLSNAEEYKLGTDPNKWDSDGDGMPDGWETARKLDAISASGDCGGDADPDGDGFSNVAEYTADTDPANGLSYLRIDATRRTAGGTVIQFPSSPDRWYDLMVSTNLVQGTWNRLLQDQPGVLSESATLTDTNATTGPRFYRIDVRVPPN